MTKISQTEWLKQQKCISQGSGGWSPRSRHPKIQCLVRALLPVHRWRLLTMSSREKGMEGGRKTDSFLLNPLTLLVPEATTLFFPSHLHCPIHLFKNGLHFLPQLPLISKFLTAGYPHPQLLEKGPPPSCSSFSHICASPKPLPS